MADFRFRPRFGQPLDECVEKDEAPLDTMDIPDHLADPRTCYGFDKRSSEMSEKGRWVTQSATFDSGVLGVGLDSFSSASSICQDFKQLSVADSRVPSHNIANVKWMSGNSSDMCDSGWGEDRLISLHTEESSRPTQQNESYLEFFEQDEDGDTQLHIAIIQCAHPVAEYIINSATDYDLLNLMNDLRQTPLHLSVITNQPQITKKLMMSGALLDLTDNKGNTALHIACKEGYLDCVEVLTTPFYVQDNQCLYQIPDQHIPQNLEAVNYEGQTCLHLAADNYLRPQPKLAYLHIVQHLLKIGANVNASDGKSGRTILHYTAEYGNMELLYVILLKQGVNLDAKTYAGKTALMLAIGRGFDIMEERLISAGAQLPPEDFDNRDSSEDMSDEDSESEYDDICIDGQPLPRS